MPLLMFSPTTVFAEDWPQWMGPKQDGVYRESGVVREIPSGGLKIKWRRDISGGYAGPSVAEGRVFVFDYVKKSGDAKNDPEKRSELQGEERVMALDAATGKPLWQHAYNCPYSISYAAGPRCTPTVDGGRVYTLGSEGDLLCLDAATGKVLWSRNLKKDFGAETPIWGFSSHPLVDGKLLYTMVGGDGQGIVAFDKETGEVRWKALKAKAGYSPASIVEAGGVRQLIAFHPEGIASLNPESGSEYWSVPIKPDYEMSVARPMLDGNLLYAGTIGKQSVLLRLAKDRPAAEVVWRDKPKHAVHSGTSTPLFVKGVIYGTDCDKGWLAAVDAEKGERLWTTFEPVKPDEKRFVDYGTAFLTRIADTNRYFILGETGDLIVAELTREGYKGLGRQRILEPTGEAFGRPVVWSHPAFANKTAYARNDKEIVAIDLASGQ